MGQRWRGGGAGILLFYWHPGWESAKDSIIRRQACIERS